MECTNCGTELYQRRRFGGDRVVWVHGGQINARAVQTCPGPEPAPVYSAPTRPLTEVELATLRALTEEFLAGADAVREAEAPDDTSPEAA